MSTNPFFSQFFETDDTADQQLVEDLIIEMIQAKGVDYYYLPRTIENFDSFFGEDSQASSFKDAFILEFYLESFKSWEGEGNIIFKTGLESREEATVCCSIRRFSEEITASMPEIKRPREGDIIVFPKAVDRATRFFEITKVDNEELHYQLGKLYFYKLNVKAFEYSGERVTTGVQALDDFEKDIMFTFSVNLTPGVTNFIPGETVFQTGGFEASVVSLFDNVLTLGRYKGELDNTLPIIGAAGEREIETIKNPTEYKDVLIDNTQLQNLESNNIIDNTESNPLLR